jgi:hypothetical protein
MGEALLNFIQESWKSDGTRFPGPQPVSIERRHFPLLKRQPYFVCEKTDGVRHLLASTEEGVFLVNRAFFIEPVKIRVPKDTLLDGELVKTKAGKSFFVVHDAVRVKGENLTSQPLNYRLDAARKVIKGIIKTAQAPFEIRVKNMHLWGSERLPALDTYEYETDGLVLTPINEPIRMGTHETMFKWKPKGRITIDFELRKGYELWVQDRGNPYKEAELHIKNKRLDLPDGTIVECGYGDLGFFVEKVRTDKTYANNRRTYFRTMINLREDIQVGELTGF